MLSVASSEMFHLIAMREPQSPLLLQTSLWEMETQILLILGFVYYPSISNLFMGTTKIPILTSPHTQFAQLIKEVFELESYKIDFNFQKKTEKKLFR